MVTVKSEEDLHYAVIFGMKTDESDIMEFLRGWEWNRITFREGKGTAYERTEKLKVSLKRLEKEREHKKALINELAAKREDLEVISMRSRLKNQN